MSTICLCSFGVVIALFVGHVQLVFYYEMLLILNCTSIREHIEKTRFSQDLSNFIDARQNFLEPALTDSGYDTGHTSTDSSSFMPLQDISFRIQPDELEPIVEDNQRSFDLVAPPNPAGDSNVFSLEKRSEQLFSRDHLQAIIDEPLLLSKFTSFISLKRPQSLPHLSYYLETQKALRAIKYANALVDALRSKSDFIQNKPQDTVNASLEDSMEEAFQLMVREDLPAYVTHVFIQVASLSIHKRITGTLSNHLQEVSEGLAEVFCLTDPSRPDNPIIFASEGVYMPSSVSKMDLQSTNRTNRVSLDYTVWSEPCNRAKL